IATLGALRVDTLFLELCTPRAGELDILGALPSHQRIGVGVANQKLTEADDIAAIEARMRHAIEVFGGERVLFNHDCGFATFADNPVSSAATTEQRLRAIVDAATRVRSGI